MRGKIDRTVNFVEYQFPAGKVTWEQALEIVGIDKNIDKSAVTPEDIRGGIIQFTTTMGYDVFWENGAIEVNGPNVNGHRRENRP